MRCANLVSRLEVAASGRATAWLCVLLFVWFFLDVGPRAKLDRPLKHRTDVTVYTGAGAAFFDGRDPYEVTNVRGWHYLYPPMFAIAMAPLSLLHTYWQAFVWFTISVALCVGCFSECRRLLEMLLPAAKPSLLKNRVVRSAVGLIAWLTAFFPFVNTMQRGQVGIAVLYPLLLGFRIVLQNQTRMRLFGGGVIFAVPVVLKLTPAMPVGFVILQQYAAASSNTLRTNWRDALCVTSGVVTGLILFLLVIPSIAVGTSENFTHLESWVQRVVAPDDAGTVNDFKSHRPRNQSFSNAMTLPGRYFGRPNMAFLDWVIKGILGGLVLALLLIGLKISRKTRAGQAAAFGISCGLSLMVSPLSWGHHYTLMVPGALLVSIWAVDTLKLKTAMVLGSIPPILCWLHWTTLEMSAQLGLLGIGTALWLAVVLVLFQRELRKSNDQLDVFDNRTPYTNHELTRAA